MVNIELMSDNLTLLLSEVIEVPEIVKYLTYNQKNPLSQPNVVSPSSLILKKIHPYPFDPIATTEDCTELRIYYPEGVFDSSGAVVETCVYIDIVVAKTLWLINDGKAAIRPYMIMKYLFEHFHKKSIGTLGRVEFTNFAHLHINETFDAIRIETNVVLFGG